MLATAIPRPTAGELAGVLAERWLVRHLAVDSRGTLPDGRPFAATCVTSWIGPAPYVPHRERGSLIVFHPNREYVIARSEVLRRARALADVDAKAVAALAKLAGCPSSLAKGLGDALVKRLPLDIRTVRIFGRRALRFVITRQRLDLYVDPATHAPVALHLRGAGGGWARLRKGTWADIKRVRPYSASLTRVSKSA